MGERRSRPEPAQARSRHGTLGLFLLLLLASSAGQAARAEERPPDPEDGAVLNGAYGNAYFDLSFPLPPGWVEGLKGPPPSYTGYYVLTSLEGDGEGRPSLLVVAQDMFFAAKSFISAREMAKDFRDAEARVPNMRIDLEPEEVKIGGRNFMRVDYSAGGLYRAWLATDIRCHIVAFNITTTDPTTLVKATLDLSRITLPAAASAETTGGGEVGSRVPVCIKDYATGPNVVHRVDPSATGPRFLKLPVRIIIGADGRVKHVHVICAFPEQRKAIEEALMQWEFKPYEANGRPAEVETGLVFEFKPNSP
jgi:hypothetical protein